MTFRQNAFMRFSLLFLAFFLILFLVLIPLYIQTLALFSEKQIAVNIAMLDKGVERLDAQIDHLRKIVYNFNQDSRYRMASSSGFRIHEDTVLTIKDIQNDFTRQIGLQLMIQDCGIIMGNGFILTRQRNFSAIGEPYNAFYGPYFSLALYDTLADFIDSTTEPETGTLLRIDTVNSYDYGIYDAIILLFPIYGNWMQNHMSRDIFYAAIPFDTFLSSVTTPEILEKGCVTIRDNSGSIIMQYPADWNGEFHSYTSFGKLTGLSVAIGIPEGLFAEQLAPIRRTLTLFLIITLAMGIFLTFIFAYNSSRPIRELASYVRRNISYRETDIPKNEYELIGRFMRQMDRMLYESSEMIKQQKTVIRANMIEKAIKGIIYLDSEIEQFRVLFPDFPSQYQLALFQIHKSPDDSFDLTISRQILLKTRLEKNISGYYLIQPMESHLVLLVLPIDNDEDKWYSWLCDIKIKLETAGLFYVQIALSNTYTMMAQLSTAFSELQYIMEFNVKESTTPVWRFRYAGNQRTTPCIEFTHMRQLYEALRTGELKVVRSILLAAQVNLLKSYQHDSLAKNEAYTFIRFVFERVQSELPGQLSELELPAMNDDVFQMIRAFETCGEKICQRINHGKPAEEEVMASELIQFIRNNYSDRNFFSKTVLYRFGISEPTMQKIVRQATGKSFFEFVEDNRLSKAHHILSTTDSSAVQAASECGFSSYNSMYRAFMRKYNIAPGAVHSSIHETK